MALTARPPVITIMGHVDHGKTSLLDYIRSTKVTAGEVGGITQHIGAYTVEFQGKTLTFIDTPGHAAFSKMRERGAALTDIVVLVVATNDGVKPQTIESIRHIKEAKVPVLVAINKVDLPDFYPDVIKAQLAEHDLLVHGFGGDIETVEISATKGTGVDKLLETLSVMAELANLQADSAAPLEAVVIESGKDPRRGCLASVIVKQGTLSVRQSIVAEAATSRVRSLVNERGEQLNQVTPGLPAEIIGFDQVPAVGSSVHDAEASYTAAEVVETSPADASLPDFSTLPPAEDLFGEQAKYKLIVKADVAGTLEAILQNLDPESTTLLFSAVGEVTEQDVDLASTTGATIISFHTKVSKHIKELALKQGVKILSYDIIYKLIEDLQTQMLKLLEPTIDETVLGEAEIMQIFEMRGERIAGIKVKKGELKRSDLHHLKRGDNIEANPVIKSMMHGKEEISSVKAKAECGMTFKNKKLDFQVGDVLVAYKLTNA